MHGFLSEVRAQLCPTSFFFFVTRTVLAGGSQHRAKYTAFIGSFFLVGQSLKILFFSFAKSHRRVKKRPTTAEFKLPSPTAWSSTTKWPYTDPLLEGRVELWNECGQFCQARFLRFLFLNFLPLTCHKAFSRIRKNKKYFMQVNDVLIGSCEKPFICCV